LIYQAVAYPASNSELIWPAARSPNRIAVIYKYPSAQIGNTAAAAISSAAQTLSVR
jgi:hypothetical protein